MKASVLMIAAIALAVLPQGRAAGPADVAADADASPMQPQESEAPVSQVSSSRSEGFLGLGASKGPVGHWSIETVAHYHMVSSLEALVDPKPLSEPVDVWMATGTKLQATHTGRAVLTPDLHLTDVLYVPGIKHNCFSVGKAISDDESITITMSNRECKIMKDERVIVIGVMYAGGYHINPNIQSQSWLARITQFF